MTLPTFVSAVMDAHLPSTDWRTWLREQLLVNGVYFNNEELYHKDKLIGWCQLLAPDDAVQSFSGASWLSLGDQGTWLGHPVGFFCWSHMLDNEEALSHLVPTLMQTCRGAVARTDTGELRHFVLEREMALRDLMSKFGCGDGDALLSRTDEDYILYVVQEAERALASAGFEGRVGFANTHHNPLRIFGELTRGGVPVKDEELHQLRGHFFRLWAFNLSVLEDYEFWHD